MGLCAGKSNSKEMKNNNLNHNNNNNPTKGIINGKIDIIIEDEETDVYTPTKPDKNPETNENLRTEQLTTELVLDEKRNSKIIIKLYSRDSFERFKDDICENLLHYLPFEDKLVLECVSKQWKRCIFNRQHFLCIEFGGFFSDNITNLVVSDNNNAHKLNKNALISVLSKCPNITNIESYRIANYSINDEILDVIANYCKELKVIKLPIFDTELSEQCLLKFGEVCGRNLKLIKFYNFNRNQFAGIIGNQKLLNSFLSYCPNLSSLFELKISLSIANTQYFSQLIYIELMLESIEDLIEFTRFADIYNQQILVLKVHVYFNIKFSDYDESMTQISRFKNIEELQLRIYSTYSVFGIKLDSALKMIAKNCLKLSKIRFKITANFLCESSILEVFGEFKRLETLVIVVKQNNVNFGSVSSLVDNLYLTHFKIVYQYLEDDNVKDIDIYCPFIKKLVLVTEQELTDDTLHSIANMENLQQIKLKGYTGINPYITDAGVTNIIDNCPQITTIYFACNPLITGLTFDKIISKAKSNPEICYEFTVGFYKSTQFKAYFDGELLVPENLIFDAFY